MSLLIVLTILILINTASLNAQSSTSSSPPSNIVPSFNNITDCKWTDWNALGKCHNGYASSVRYCYCNGRLVDGSYCGSDRNESFVFCIDDDQKDFFKNQWTCLWQWGKWDVCSKPCGTYPPGNTSREQYCACFGVTSNNSYCEGTKKTESAECNHFDCEARPHSKQYWINNIKRGWPLSLNTKFNCGKADSYGFGKLTWFKVLSDPIYASNIAWHFLAKEYITTRLNRGAGCILPESTFDALEDAQQILTNCADFTANEIQKASLTKEKLIRYNSGIGAITLTYDYLVQNAESQYSNIRGDESKLYLHLHPASVVVPAVLLAVALFLFFGVIIKIQRLKESKLVVVENEAFLTSSSDDESIRDERSAEELRL